MRCPICDGDTKVRKTKSLAGDGLEQVTKRTRICLECNERFTTYERVRGSRGETMLRAAVITNEAVRTATEHVTAALKALSG